MPSLDQIAAVLNWVTFSLCAMALLHGWPCHADQITIHACKDNTLIESMTGDVSNGAGDSVRCGRTGDAGGNIRLRGAFQFDVARVIPQDAIVTNATLELQLIRSSSGPLPASIHLMLNSWGEGSSMAGGGQGDPADKGDVTWLYRFFSNEKWQQQGGEFELMPAHTELVGFIPGPVSWSSSAMSAHVQQWVNDPTTNFGWMLVGEEAFGYTAKRFASREYPILEFQPRLHVQYEPGLTRCPGDVSRNGWVDVGDLMKVIESWGLCIGNECEADIAPPAGNGVVDVDDLLVVINKWGICEM